MPWDVQSLHVHYTLGCLSAEEYGSEDKAVHDAIRELEDLRSTAAESQNGQSGKKKKKLTLSQLQEYFSQELARTSQDGVRRDGNSAFEEEVLGWAQPTVFGQWQPKTAVIALSVVASMYSSKHVIYI